MLEHVPLQFHNCFNMFETIHLVRIPVVVRKQSQTDQQELHVYTCLAYLTCVDSV